MRLPPYRVALAVGEPHEARLLTLLEDPAFAVGGRGCTVTTFCSTIREVREALGRSESIDVVVLSSTLQAVPAATLEALVATGRPLVVATRCWATGPSGRGPPPPQRGQPRPEAVPPVPPARTTPPRLRSQPAAKSSL